MHPTYNTATLAYHNFVQVQAFFSSLLSQDKPVFVYKLIAAGSIEEKIVAMQEKKAVLADLILGDDCAKTTKFSAEDLVALFAPLPPLSPPL